MKKKVIITEVSFDEEREKIFRVINPADGTTLKYFFDESDYLAFVSDFEDHVDKV